MKSKQLYGIARRYHKKCELYALKMCEHRDIDGKAIPMTKAEKDRVKYYQVFELDWQISLGHFDDISEKDIRNAIKNYKG